MKLVIATLLATSTLAFSKPTQKGELDFTCRSEKTTTTQALVVKLKQLKPGQIKEGQPVPFELSVAVVHPSRHQSQGRLSTYVGHVVTEDVQVFFNSLDKNVHLLIFLDELNETTLTFKGKDGIQMECEEHRW